MNVSLYMVILNFWHSRLCEHPTNEIGQGETKVKYFQSIPAIVSSSMHEDSALVIGSIHPSTYMQEQMREKTEAYGEGKSTKVAQRATSNQTIFTVPKGVTTFDFCKNRNLLVTGGMDKLLRMWMPYVLRKPTGILKGHTTPVSYLCIASEDGHIFSVSTDNTAKIWHIKDQTCLFTAHPKASQIQGELSACLYSSAVKGLYIASDSLALRSLQTKFVISVGWGHRIDIYLRSTLLKSAEVLFGVVYSSIPI
ncbi:hypothetical protein cypCar_00039268 [Cyprinus carpio]|nr:hypothetical protein cypCar_00039268 [Cyprinus carpio]